MRVGRVFRPVRVRERGIGVPATKTDQRTIAPIPLIFQWRGRSLDRREKFHELGRDTVEVGVGRSFEMGLECFQEQLSI